MPAVGRGTPPLAQPQEGGGFRGGSLSARSTRSVATQGGGLGESIGAAPRKPPPDGVCVAGRGGRRRPLQNRTKKTYRASAPKTLWRKRGSINTRHHPKTSAQKHQHKKKPTEEAREHKHKTSEQKHQPQRPCGGSAGASTQDISTRHRHKKAPPQKRRCAKSYSRHQPTCSASAMHGSEREPKSVRTYRNQSK